MAGADRWVHRVLLAAASGSPTELLLREAGPSDWEALARAASAHGAEGWLARALRDETAVPHDFQIQLQAAALRLAAAHSERLAEAGSYLAALHDRRIPAMVLKGPAVVERYYGDSTLRSYGDIDIYVRPQDFRRALEVLRATGLAVSDRNWDFALRDLRGQLHLARAGKGTVEIHWHLVNGARQRRTLGMTSDEGWEVAQPSALGHAPCYRLPSEEELAHLSLHAAMHGCNRLIWLIDLKCVAGTVDLDWERVIERLRSWNFSAGGWAVLETARIFTDAPIPTEVLERFRPSRTRRALLRRIHDRWDLGAFDAGARPREVFFATASDGLAKQVSLSAEILVPAPGSEGSAGSDLRRRTIGTLRRLRTRLAAGPRPAEYRESSRRADEETYLRAVESFGASDASRSSHPRHP